LPMSHDRCRSDTAHRRDTLISFASTRAGCDSSAAVAGLKGVHDIARDAGAAEPAKRCGTRFARRHLPCGGIAAGRKRRSHCCRSGPSTDFGLQLEGLEEAEGKVPAQSVTLKVYEVSYCDPSRTTDCGPGVNASTTGVKSYLYFWFHSQTSSESNTFTEDFVTAYNPNRWLPARFGK